MPEPGLNAYVFLGPTLPVAEAAGIFDAIYLPPIQQGDLLRLLERRPALIGIVDGYFDTVPAVWHKEILIAIEQGVRVFGSSSMGALRAAELHEFGMIGVGTIFEWYRDGVITADDEVAVSHAPRELGYQALTEPLVDIRDRCVSAVHDGVIGQDVADRLLATAQATPYRLRSCEQAVARVRADGFDVPELAAWLDHARTEGPPLKARDAQALLRTMRNAARPGLPPVRPACKVERTTFIERLRNDILFESVSGRLLSSCSDATVVRAGETVPGLRKHCCLRLAARLVAEQLGWKLTIEEVDDYAARFRQQFGLADPEAMQKWMEAEGISEETFWRFVNDALFVGRLEHLHSAEIESAMTDQLRIMTARERMSAAS
jgi:hypothetical protein